MPAISEVLTCHFQGKRLERLAELEGITLGVIAERLSISQPRLSKIIHGTADFPPEVAELAATQFQVPESFFRVVTVPQDLAAPTFRKKSTALVRASKRVTALLSEAARLWRVTSTNSGYHTATLPDPKELEDDVERAALAVREIDGLAEEAPVPNVTRLLERLGVAVIDRLDPNLPEGADHSGISQPSIHEDRPIIATVAQQPGAVARLTKAHELGHLIFDHDLPRPPRARDDEELRALAFAGALLLPEGMMRKRVSETLTLHAYLRIKADYGVSVGAILKRANMLQLISDDRYRSLSIQLASQGWRTNEPVKVGHERPLLLTQALRRVWPWATAETASKETGVPSALIRAWAGLDEARQADPADAKVVSLDAYRNR